MIIILDPAEEELREIFVYYETQRRRLGYRFLGEFERSIARIGEIPEAFPLVVSNYTNLPNEKVPVWHILFRREQRYFHRSDHSFAAEHEILEAKIATLGFNGSDR